VTTTLLEVVARAAFADAILVPDMKAVLVIVAAIVVTRGSGGRRRMNDATTMPHTLSSSSYDFSGSKIGWS
jgi:hypothetical protein